jgi:hypothetical protein
VNNDHDTIIGRDIYFRYTDKEGNVSVREQRTWDKDRMIQSLQDAARKEGGKAGVQQITREQYLQER